MSSIIAVSLAIGLVLNIACTAYVAFALRSRHRYLFARTQRICQAIPQLADELRIEHRLSEIRHTRKPIASTLPARFTAQAGEDILIYDFFKDSPPGYFVEAGAYDGIAFSNTYLLESLGWTGMLVEPHPDYARSCQANRPGSSVRHAALGPNGSRGEIEFTCADSSAGGPLSFLKSDTNHVDRCQRENCVLRKVAVPYTCLDALLEGSTDRVNFLSLDVEGMELELLQGINLRRYRPELIVVESADRPHDEKLTAHLRDHGYEAAGRKGCNLFFVTAAKSEQFRSLCGLGARLGLALEC